MLARNTWQLLVPSSLALFQIGARHISSELTTALRPFYFAVHPDLFGQHPKQRTVNENSLKQLSSHIESLYDRKLSVLSEVKILEFYIRDSSVNSRDSFKLIKITLDKQIREPKVLVQKLLELCNLPTDYIRNVKDRTISSPPVKPQQWSREPPNASTSKFDSDYNYGNAFMNFEAKFNQMKSDVKPTLHDWLRLNKGLARLRVNELNDLKEEIVKLKKSVSQRLGLIDVRYDCGWNFEHFRGCLKTLERLIALHERHMDVLRGRIVVFAPFTGVSLEGHIMLYTGDVLNNWIDFIRNIAKEDEFLTKIPLYENTLSQVLLQIKVARRKFMPKQQAKEYAAHLTKVTTTIGDYLTKSKYPKSWPDSLRDYEIVIESEAGPLMVGPTGQFIAPSTCPGFILIDFITNNLTIAKERMQKYSRQKHIERHLLQCCINDLRLLSLTKDDSVTPDKMIVTLNNLLQSRCEELSGIDLHITNYYSVLADGIVCIPWDFKTR